MAQHGLTRRAALLLLLASPAAAQDFMRMPLAELEQQAETLPPAGLYALAARRFREGPRQEAVRWLYVAQLRARFRLAVTPDLPRDGEPALYAALNESVGRPINEWAFGDVDALAASLQAALDWDAAHANAATPKPGHEAALAQIRAGLAELRETVLASREKIRQQRAANGLENR